MSIRLDEARIRLLNINGGIQPTVNNTYNLGTSSLKWANVYATTFHGVLNGNANTATALTTSAGSITQPIYFLNGKPTQITLTFPEAAITTGFDTAFRTSINGSTSTSPFLGVVRTDTASVTYAPQYGSGIVWGKGDTHGYLYVSYSGSIAYLGGGNTDKLNWVKQIAFTDSNVASADKLATARTISLTGSVTGSGSFDGSGNLSINTTTNHNHDDRYLNISGDTMTGALNFKNSTWNLMGDDCYIGDCDQAGCIGIKGNNGATGLYFTPYSGSTAQKISINGSGTMTITGTVASTFSGNLSGNASTASKLATARTISLTDDVSGSGSFDGSGNLSIAATVADNSHNHTWLQLAPGNISLPTGASMSADTGPFNIRWFSTAGLIAGQPSQYGFLMTISAGKGSVEQHQLWFTQCDGDIYHRGTNGGNSDSPPSFKRLWQEGHSITGAVWNDYAEYRESDCKEFGYVLAEKGDDTLTKTTERLQPFAGVSSDTWGFCQGETEKAKTPIAVAGRVLVYTYRDKEEYKPGDVVCAAPNGTIDIMTREEVINYPDRIVGTVSCVPEYDIWGSGDRDPVKVNGRIWIKVR